uniref:Ig-like domain-containing protein n=1 Tax=Nothobranchius furzeri TaxID=105023 RepID=A0A8C6K8F0_NOTFU
DLRLTACAVLPEVRPDRLQFFEYSSVSVRCGGVGGSNAWRVWRKLNTAGSPEACDTSAPSCTINPATEKHSGEYWCVTGEGGRSGAVNISVTAGLVILDIPARPVAEGSDLTLRCIDKTSELDHITDFYKDGVYLKIGYKNHLTLQKISRSDEGRYRCSISGKGESPDSRLAVGSFPGPDGGTRPLMLPLVFLAVPLLLLLVGLILFRKCKGTSLMGRHYSRENQRFIK